MKKNIIISIIVLVLISGIIGAYYLVGGVENSVNIMASSKTASLDVSEVDWSKYSTYEADISSGNVTISKSGVYYITGSTSEYNIYIKTNDNVKLVLDSVSITTNGEPAIYVDNANNTYIELIGENTINSTTSDELDAAIFSRDDLILYGDGRLNITSNKDGIASKDDLTIISGTYNIESTEDGIKGKDSVYIVDGTFTINGSDGIKTTNDEDTEKGSLVIDNGTFTIVSSKDGIESVSNLTINNGVFDITTNSSTDDSTKGIKAAGDIIINDGEFTLNTIDDGIHSNSNITINGGTYTIKTSDDAIHADIKVTINNGTININAHEGIEGSYITINDGDIDIYGEDDCINATKSDVSGVTPTIEINGGNISVEVGQGDTDAIDSNGNIYVNGGSLNITAQSPFDYDGEAKYTAGTIIINGTETNTITNQMMGGGMMPGNMNEDSMQGGNMRQGGNGFRR